MSFPAELLLLACLLLSILSTGLAIVHRFLRMRGLNLIAYGIGAGILIHGLFGLWIALVAHYHRQIAGILGCLVLIALVYLWKQKVIVDLFRDLAHPIKIFLGIWIAFVVCCIAITHLQVRWPDTLPDGQFVFKTHTTNVKVQVMTWLPTDNSIAFMVQEYLLRRIPFEQERGIIPYLEVTQRTILMPLVGLPFRALLDPPPRYQKPLPKFHYGSGDWPNTQLLYTESGFRQFLTISIALNALLLLGAGLFCANLGMGAALPLAAFSCATNIYFVSQTIYSWPKAFAGFFVALAWDAFRRQRDPILVGACTALAYQCHPYAIAFIGGMGVCFLLEPNANTRWRNVIRYSAIVMLLLLPWFIWTRFIVQIPSTMFSYNFNPGGADAIFPNPIWVRLNNLFRVFVPTFPTIYPFDFKNVITGIPSSLPGVVGFILFVPAIVRLLRLDNRILLYAGICLPAALLVFVFGFPTFPVVLGLQPIIALLCFFGVAHMRERLRPAIYWSVIALQLFFNVIVTIANGYLVGAHVA